MVGHVVFQREKFIDAIEEMRPLLAANWKETGWASDIELEIDKHRYQQIDDLGLLRLFTARDLEGLLLGYAVFMVAPSLHHMGLRQALQDVIYISPDKRGFGIRFIKWCDQQFKDEGVHAVHHHVTEKLRWGVILKRMGYELVSSTYIKRLDLGVV